MHAMNEPDDLPDINAVFRAQARIAGLAQLSPVLSDTTLDGALDCTLFCKCEHLQRTGAFKFRGASNAIASLRESGTEGDVATHSSGNHGAALALAAQLDGRKAHVVMPENASPVKIEAVQRYGGIIHFCAPTHAAREAGLARLVQSGNIPIPPYDHVDIIAGQGTAALELVQAYPGLDVLVAPVGGGGLIGGIALVGHHHGIEVVAAEPAGAADTAASLARGHRVESWEPDTIADGLRALVGVRNFTLIQRYVSQVLTVTDDQIRAAMRLFWQHTRMVIEPSSAVAIAAIQGYPGTFQGKRVGVIISGANISPADWVNLVEGVES